jgi:hypothetical protein
MRFQEILGQAWMGSVLVRSWDLKWDGIMQLASKGQECIRGRQMLRPIPILGSQEGLAQQPMP